MSDLIDRQAAISYAISGRIRTLPTSEDGENWIRTSEVRQSLLTMPSAQQWIPVSERLPEKSNMYTVTDSKGDVVRFVFTGTESSKEYWRRCAKAWMPLPEPYRGGQE